MRITASAQAHQLRPTVRSPTCVVGTRVVCADHQLLQQSHPLTTVSGVQLDTVSCASLTSQSPSMTTVFFTHASPTTYWPFETFPQVTSHRCRAAAAAYSIQDSTLRSRRNGTLNRRVAHRYRRRFSVLQEDSRPQFQMCDYETVIAAQECLALQEREMRGRLVRYDAAQSLGSLRGRAGSASLICQTACRNV
jgi:hypothetical protein